MIKTRKFPKDNYRSIYFNGKTIRQTYDQSKPIKDLEFPEFYDVKITNKCEGKCSWCYQDSLPENDHFDKIIEKSINYFGVMSDNEKPFQVAIGGGEPTSHPDFIELLDTFDKMGITPNYTTNGMNLSEDIISATKKHCGGVAISCHSHLEKYWSKAIAEYSKLNVKLNLHIIISDNDSIRAFEDIYNKYSDVIDYFVLLPHTAKGRAVEKEIECENLFSVIDKLDTDKIAFGAMFYPYIKEDKNRYKISLYEPEIMSKYISFENSGLMYKSSFCDNPIKRDLFDVC